jgi:hypothetical protein
MASQTHKYTLITIGTHVTKKHHSKRSFFIETIFGKFGTKNTIRLSVKNNFVAQFAVIKAHSQEHNCNGRFLGLTLEGIIDNKAELRTLFPISTIQIMFCVTQL